MRSRVHACTSEVAGITRDAAIAAWPDEHAEAITRGAYRQTAGAWASTRGERVSKTFAVCTSCRGAAACRPTLVTRRQQVQKLVDADRARGIRVSVETKRIGIEGERRMCVTYESAREGGRMLERVAPS